MKRIFGLKIIGMLFCSILFIGCDKYTRIVPYYYVCNDFDGAHVCIDENPYSSYMLSQSMSPSDAENLATKLNRDMSDKWLYTMSAEGYWKTK